MVRGIPGAHALAGLAPGLPVFPVHHRHRPLDRIDALAVGITFAFLEVDILPAVCCIALTTFLLSSLGVKFGSLCGTRMQSKAEALGGVILILLGLKILLEHLGIF